MSLFCFLYITPPSPPPQPESGPGGKDYKYQYVKSSYYVPENNQNYQFWIFEPDSVEKDTLPVIVFIHGWSAITPKLYTDFIYHIVKKGNIVIFPGYQKNAFVPPRSFTDNLIKSLQYAFNELNTGGHFFPDYERFAITGHSMGGILSANLANRCDSLGFPKPKAVMCQEPGDGDNNVSEDDKVVGSADADSIYELISHIPHENKDFITVRTDTYGEPDLIADHSAPTNSELDAIDFYCFWKLFDALTDAAFYGKNREYALGNTPEQRFMGLWSDGTPVKEPLVREEEGEGFYCENKKVELGNVILLSKRTQFKISFRKRMKK